MFKLTVLALACCLGTTDARQKDAHSSTLKVRQRVSNLEVGLAEIKMMLVNSSSASAEKCECQTEMIGGRRLKDVRLKVRTYRRLLNRLQRSMDSMKTQITDVRKTSKQLQDEVCQSRFRCSDWSVWGDCTGTCGNGYQTRSRECALVRPEPEIDVCDGYVSHVLESRECLRKRICRCPRGYEADVYGFCFKLSLDFKTEAEAIQICSQDGGHLAVMDSEEKHKAVGGVVQNVQKWRDVLVDGRKRRGSNDWLTWDNKVMTFFKWRMDQLEKDEDLCVVVCTNDYFWYRYPCKLRYHYLCEVDSFN